MIEEVIQQEGEKVWKRWVFKRGVTLLLKCEREIVNRGRET